MHAILSGMNVCTAISEALYMELTNAPDEFHVTAIADAIPNAVETQGIRGQLVQGFTAVIQLVQKSTSNQKFVHSASGKASISVESAGQMICFDATTEGFNSSRVQLHSGAMETSGSLVMDLSPTKVGAGRFLGCRSLETLGIDIETGFLLTARSITWAFPLLSYKMILEHRLVANYNQVCPQKE